MHSYEHYSRQELLEKIEELETTIKQLSSGSPLQKEEDFSRSCSDFPNPVKIDPVQGKMSEIFVANLCESFRGYVIILSVDEKLPAF